MQIKLTHWQINKDDHENCWLILNMANTDTNVLSEAVLNELSSILDKLEANLPRSIIFRSGKSNGFIAGADVKEFLNIKTQQEALILIKRGQALFTRIENLPCPTLAIIEGFCMGGGTELTLACDYRLALDDSKTRIGLPEVKLGIHPAYGGVVRSTAIISPLKSLELMLSGRALAAKQARSIGLVDFVQPARQIDRAAIQIVKTKPPRRQMPFTGQFLSLPLIRNLVASVMKNQVSKKVSRTHYPAPFAIIDLWRDHFGDKKRMMEEEANSVARLIQGETVLNLIRVFFLQNQLKNQIEDKKFNPQHVHVIGAGIMGGDIAAWCALKGMTVTLEDREPKYLSNAIGRANKLFNKKLRTVHERNAVSDRLIPDTHGYGVANADVIIEAIFEDIEAKQAIYERIEPRMKPDAILATNTSSIPLETLSSGLKDPERLVGIHFFNPVAIMPLVEIVKTSDTSPKTVAKAATFVQKIGKLPLPVRSSPGFLVNRILLPYLVEAMILYNEGIAIEAIDKAALDFGMPMGPIELADTVGLDICQSVAQNLSRTFNYDLPPILESYIKAGNLGKKTGRGIYRYKKGKPVKDKDASLGDQKIIQKRLIYRLLNEAASCLEEGIVENVNLLDAGIIFGTGFAPFRGGPLHYSQSIGLEAVIADLEVFADKYGSGFKPSSGWKLIGD